MRRREFIGALGSAAAWPLAARAQQPGKLPTIGFLGAATPTAWGKWTAAFVQRLRELGWIDGRNVAIEFRWAEGRPERYAEIAAEFVRLNPASGLLRRRIGADRSAGSRDAGSPRARLPGPRASGGRMGPCDGTRLRRLTGQALSTLRPGAAAQR
jgi:hypothetical protein